MVPPLRVKVDLGVVAMKIYFSKCSDWSLTIQWISVISRIPQFLWVADILPMTQGELCVKYMTGRDVMISEKHTNLYIIREC